MSVCGREPSHLDGRGGSEPLGFAVYYRLYTNNNALESNHPIYSNDKFVGRILFKSITPPRNVSSLKRNLCKVEGFEGIPTCALYLSLSEKAPAEDLTRLSLCGLGSSELAPMALVVLNDTEVEKRLAASNNLDSNTLPEWPHERQYVHYRTYDNAGKIVSKTSFDETDTSLGRLDALSVPPPHNGTSLKARLSQAEKLSASDFKLFKDDSGEIILNCDKVVNFLSDNYPGIIADEPVAIVYDPQQATCDPIPQGFSRKLRSKVTGMGASDPTWHSQTQGEIFHSDGVVTRKRYYIDGWVYNCYDAINSRGKRGCGSFLLVFYSF
ncbi:hypothetical protein K443DRAFT_94770 [Laccaria amethystina LaAM-08-1]|uniref:Uncharacterized protein n=1 Tax=Laccaria amethystina LaAM-08-1 TaxID=1095629 RepID=A0A0C9XPW0_9AGAR|nr:hypothetical protein K443DRAFT_94770 [Laccaria amethystina LaAM-08-1]